MENVQRVGELEHSAQNGTSLSNPFPQGSGISARSREANYKNQRWWKSPRKYCLLDPRQINMTHKPCDTKSYPNQEAMSKWCLLEEGKSIVSSSWRALAVSTILQGRASCPTAVGQPNMDSMVVLHFLFGTFVFMYCFDLGVVLWREERECEVEPVGR